MNKAIFNYFTSRRGPAKKKNCFFGVDWAGKSLIFPLSAQSAEVIETPPVVPKRELR